jgi:hypothetical protein
VNAVTASKPNENLRIRRRLRSPFTLARAANGQ